MKVKINGYEIEGTPDEIKDLIGKQEVTYIPHYIPTYPTPWYPATPQPCYPWTRYWTTCGRGYSSSETTF